MDERKEKELIDICCKVHCAILEIDAIRRRSVAEKWAERLVFLPEDVSAIAALLLHASTYYGVTAGTLNGANVLEAADELWNWVSKYARIATDGKIINEEENGTKERKTANRRD